jgi:hypothetical protein
LYMEIMECMVGSVKMIAINGTYKVSDSVYFVSEDQITHLPSVVVGQVVNERSNLCCLVLNWTVTIMMLCC